MESIWHQTSAAAPRPPLEEDLSAEAAVIGGGMAGILTAALLEEAGVRTVVLEADRVGSGQTGNTTAKVTSQHGDCYRRLEERLGAEAAVQYAGAGQEAVEAFRQLIRRRRLDCAWEELPAYLYALSPRSSLEEEAAAQQRAGLPVRLTRKTGLPFPVKEALRCDGQGQLHPLRLLHALARELTVYEGARVLAAEGDRLHTAGGSVRAERIIFACHFPFVNMPGYYFLRMHQERSYVLALSGAPALPGMYYSVDPGGLSLRTAQGLLLAGGGGHRTGENRSGGAYASLARSAGLLFPGVREAARWSAQDCMTLDGVPYIGPFSSSAPMFKRATRGRSTPGTMARARWSSSAISWPVRRISTRGKSLVSLMNWAWRPRATRISAPAWRHRSSTAGRSSVVVQQRQATSIPSWAAIRPTGSTISCRGRMRPKRAITISPLFYTKRNRFRPTSSSRRRSATPSTTRTTISQVALTVALFRWPPNTRPSRSPALMCRWG